MQNLKDIRVLDGDVTDYGMKITGNNNSYHQSAEEKIFGTRSANGSPTNEEKIWGTSQGKSNFDVSRFVGGGSSKSKSNFSVSKFFSFGNKSKKGNDFSSQNKVNMMLGGGSHPKISQMLGGIGSNKKNSNFSAQQKINNILGGFGGGGFSTGFNTQDKINNILGGFGGNGFNRGGFSAQQRINNILGGFGSVPNINTMMNTESRIHRMLGGRIYGDRYSMNLEKTQEQKDNELRRLREFADKNLIIPGSVDKYDIAQEYYDPAISYEENRNILADKMSAVMNANEIKSKKDYYAEKATIEHNNQQSFKFNPEQAQQNNPSGEYIQVYEIENPSLASTFAKKFKAGANEYFGGNQNKGTNPAIENYKKSIYKKAFETPEKIFQREYELMELWNKKQKTKPTTGYWGQVLKKGNVLATNFVSNLPVATQYVSSALGADRVPMGEKVDVLMGGRRDYSIVIGKKGKISYKYNPQAAFERRVMGAYPTNDTTGMTRMVVNPPASNYGITMMTGGPSTGMGFAAMANPRSTGMFSGSGAMESIEPNLSGASGFQSMVNNLYPRSNNNTMNVNELGSNEPMSVYEGGTIGVDNIIKSLKQQYTITAPPVAASMEAQRQIPMQPQQTAYRPRPSNVNIQDLNVPLQANGLRYSVLSRRYVRYPRGPYRQHQRQIGYGQQPVQTQSTPYYSGV